ncbi:hypothetical protein [Streptomyces sp. CA-111067]|uniref:hypothetical protein n=1 Tax=Streptomyces sp. CA-111067 TaxID=3240046 RepID=UPI003D96B0FF
MTGLDPGGARVCDGGVRLPAGLVAAALAMETVPGAACLADVEETPACLIQEHAPDTPHYGLVLDLDGILSGAVWAVWSPGGAPHLVVLPDCPGDGEQSCSGFAAHPGLHTSALWDLRQAHARAVFAAATHP